MSLHVKKGDNVKILAGKDKGNTGKITAVSPEKGRVVVENSNIIIKHIKAKNAQKQSSIQKVAGSIDASNVQIICPSCDKPTRVAHAEVEVNGKTKWKRICKKCGKSLDVKATKAVDKKAKKSKKDEPVKDDKKAKNADKVEKAVKPEKPRKVDKSGKNADGAVV